MNKNAQMVERIAKLLIAGIPGCHPISVGGSVRDGLMQAMVNNPDPLGWLRPKFEDYEGDFDLEIFRASELAVLAVLNENDIAIELVGRSFPVYKVKDHDIDISFPRKETCTGTSHTDFIVETDPQMSFKEAALRRDFTVNAIGYDWRTWGTIDLYGGIADLREGSLRVVSDKFSEDALRLLRAFKFIGRYNFTPEVGTIARCIKLVEPLSTYARERIQGEWLDVIMKFQSGYVHKAFEFLRAIDANNILFPEIFGLKDVQQDPGHHPEGDVYNHTLWCFDAFCAMRHRIEDDRDKLVIGLAVLCHDMGKKTNTEVVDGKVRAYGHEDSPLCRKFLERLFDPADTIITEVEQLVKSHMRPVSLYNNGGSLSSIRRLNVAVNGRIDRLMKVVACDQSGRPGRTADLSVLTWIDEQLTKIKVDKTSVIKPIIMGRHIIEHLKLAPGPVFTNILNNMFEAQLDGRFIDEATGIAYLTGNPVVA